MFKTIILAGAATIALSTGAAAQTSCKELTPAIVAMADQNFRSHHVTAHAILADDYDQWMKNSIYGSKVKTGLDWTGCGQETFTMFGGIYMTQADRDAVKAFEASSLTTQHAAAKDDDAQLITAPVVDDVVPHYDVEYNCHHNLYNNPMSAAIINSCRNTEQAAYDALKASWSGYSIEGKAACMNWMEGAGHHVTLIAYDYTQLRNCMNKYDADAAARANMTSSRPFHY